MELSISRADNWKILRSSCDAVLLQSHWCNGIESSMLTRGQWPYRPAETLKCLYSQNVPRTNNLPILIIASNLSVWSIDHRGFAAGKNLCSTQASNKSFVHLISPADFVEACWNALDLAVSASNPKCFGRTITTSEGLCSPAAIIYFTPFCSFSSFREVLGDLCSFPRSALRFVSCRGITCTRLKFYCSTLSTVNE